MIYYSVNGVQVTIEQKRKSITRRKPALLKYFKINKPFKTHHENQQSIKEFIPRIGKSSKFFKCTAPNFTTSHVR